MNVGGLDEQSKDPREHKLDAGPLGDGVVFRIKAVKIINLIIHCTYSVANPIRKNQFSWGGWYIAVKILCAYATGPRYSDPYQDLIRIEIWQPWCTDNNDGLCIILGTCIETS